MIAGVYARKSTEQNGVSDEARSVTRQVEHARAYAARKGWKVADEHVYVDDGISGAEFLKRPGFVRLMSAVDTGNRKPPFQFLVMSEESRLGREMVETMRALYQLVKAGVRVFYYLEDKERTLDGPLDKVMMAMETFGAELEREKSRQRTYDAMARKAKAGHVTGGRVFGYDNRDMLDASGKRSHVERIINDDEATVVRRIFEMSAAGHGFTCIAKALNAERVPTPRAQQGRPAGWSQSSIREVLLRPLYKGDVVWNKSRKRDKWGHKRQAPRPEHEHVRVAVPELRIISDELWNAAHAKLSARRQNYHRPERDGFSRPVDGRQLKYLLSGSARCGSCGGSLIVVSRSHGKRRAFFYACSSFYKKGSTVCANNLLTPVPSADNAVLAVLESDVLRPRLVDAIIAESVDRLTRPRRSDDSKRAAVQRAITTVEVEQQQLVAAVTAGGADVSALVAALRERQERLVHLRAQLSALTTPPAVPSCDHAALTQAARQRLADWRSLLRANVADARRILAKLLDGRLTFTPRVDGQRRFYEFTGKGKIQDVLVGIFEVAVTTNGVPNGIRTRVLALKGPRPGPLDDGDAPDGTQNCTTRLFDKCSAGDW